MPSSRPSPSDPVSCQDHLLQVLSTAPTRANPAGSHYVFTVQFVGDDCPQTVSEPLAAYGPRAQYRRSRQRSLRCMCWTSFVKRGVHDL